MAPFVRSGRLLYLHAFLHTSDKHDACYQVGCGKLASTAQVTCRQTTALVLTGLLHVGGTEFGGFACGVFRSDNVTD